MTDPAFDIATAARFADLALANVAQEFPNQPQQVLLDAADARRPRDLHPAFFGSYDWHSCVHMHWLLARTYLGYPDLPQRGAIASTFDAHFAPAAIAAECAYLERPHTRAFERTYGWAWLLKLATELGAIEDANGRRWQAQLAPLVEVFVRRYLDYLPRARYPLRYGLHNNSAFGLAFALDFARGAGHWPLEALIATTARAWFENDRDVPATWEPSGADFLSPALMEAELMRRVMLPAEFGGWLGTFLPGLAQGVPRTLFIPAVVADRSDPQIVHLDGLNLSRAWCMRGIASALPAADGRVPVLLAAAAAHVDAGWEGLASGDYLGAHWLASFAALALAG